MDRVPIQFHDVWISDIGTVASKNTEMFDAVVSVCQDACWDNISDDAEQYHIRLADDGFEQRGSKTYDAFEAAAMTVGALLDRGVTTLVHCHAGQNRSVSTTAAALGAYHRLPYSGVMKFVREARPTANVSDRYERYADRFIKERV